MTETKIKSEKSEKNPKSGKRYDVFMIVINVKTNKDYSKLKNEELIKFLEDCNFPGAIELENLLLDMRIDSRYTSTELMDFKGQMERGTKNQRIHWQLCIQTKKQTQVKKVLSAFSNMLYQNENDPSIQVTVPMDVSAAFEYVLKEGRVVLEKSKYYPGYVDINLANFRVMINSDEGLKAVLSSPRMWQEYLLKIMKEQEKTENPPDDRSVYIILDFHGMVGKSKFVEYLRLNLCGIQCYNDQPRALAKAVIIEASSYQKQHKKQPPNVFFDFPRQLSPEHLETFYSVVEEIKNKYVVSTFSNYSKYNWVRSPGVFIFGNLPPQHNALSKDRFQIYEILPKEFQFAIRRASVELILDHVGKDFVKFHYESFATTESQIREFSPQHAKYKMPKNLKQMLKIKHSKTGQLVKDYVGRSEQFCLSRRAHLPEILRFKLSEENDLIMK